MADDLVPPRGIDTQSWWAARPGSRLVPSAEPTPHTFGQSDIEAPACPGCGHRILVWFDLDVASIPELAALVPWKRLPLLSCIDCVMWLYPHHYGVDRAGRAVTLLRTDGRREACDRMFDVARELRPQYAQVVPIVGGREPADCTVGGRPFWYQHPGVYPSTEPPRCCQCGDRMRYLACRYRMDAFQFIPADDGMPYQYHFGCARCDVLMVFSAWS
jgi:hypothetical protein